MHPFYLSRPATVADALLARAADVDCQYLAGGQSLIGALKQRRARPAGLIDIARLSELKGVRVKDGALIVGAAVTHAELADITRLHLPALSALASSIGDMQVRNMGTLGGALAHADPASDIAAAVLGLNGAIITDRRTIAAAEFFLGPFDTALEPGELIVEVAFPVPRRAAYAKLRNPASGFPIAGVMVARARSGAIAVAVTGAAPTPFRWTAAEAAFPALDTLTLPAEGLNQDLHATAAYRAHLVAHLTRQAAAGIGR